MKIRQITANFHYCNSGMKEEKTVNCIFTDDNEKYLLTKVYVVELQKKVLFSKTDNTFLIND